MEYKQWRLAEPLTRHGKPVKAAGAGRHR